MKVGKILAWLGNAFLILGVLCVFTLFFILPNVGIEMRYILTASMTPTLGVGDAVGVAKVDISEIKEGDMVVFRVKDLVIAHRAVKIEGFAEDPTLLTKGDALNHVDPWRIGRGDLIGKIIFRIPLIGYSAKIFKDKVGFFFGSAFVLFLAVLVIIDIIKDDGGPRRKKRRRRRDRTAVITAIIGGMVILGLWFIMGRSIIIQNMDLTKMVRSGGETRYMTEKYIENKGVLPLILVMDSDAESFGLKSFWLMPGDKQLVRFLDSEESVGVKSGAFFPFLPKSMIEGIFSVSPHLAAATAASVLIAPLVIVILISGRRKKRFRRKGGMNW